jgi:hypothetical protein
MSVIDNPTSELYPWLISELIDRNEWESKKYFSAPDLINVVKQLSPDINTPIVGMEIGVASGWNIYNFLSNIPNLHLIGVDPYIPFQDWNTFVGEDILSAQHQAAIENTKQFEGRILLIKDRCENILGDYPDESLDYIFIDGDHSEESVYRDCKNFYPKVRKGGIFSGHDYGMQAVNSALNKFRSEGNYPPIATCRDNVWYWVKQ